ncbi:MAG TPA: YceI family protein [Bacteroidia bacterium]|nr:YceI family protein [Bacteroidia bacterium]
MKFKSLFIALAITSSAFAQTNWKLDNAHSSVKFSVEHLKVSETEGNFKGFASTLTSKNADFTDAEISFTVDVKTINTDNEMRDKHLQSDDFFNAEKYPQMKFKGSSFKKVSGNKYVLEGDLTIRDVTKKVKFDVVYRGIQKDPYGNTVAGFKATGSIKRLEYGLKWNVMTEATAVVADDVNIVINLEYNQAK